MKAVTRSEHKQKELIICIYYLHFANRGPRWYSQTYELYAGWNQFYWGRNSRSHPRPL